MIKFNYADRKDKMEYNTKYLNEVQDTVRRYYKYLGLTDDIVQEATVQFLASYNDNNGKASNWMISCLKSKRNAEFKYNQASRRIPENSKIKIDSFFNEYGEKIESFYLRDDSVVEFETNEERNFKYDGMQKILELLTKKQRLVFELKLEGFNYERIAERIGTSKQNIRGIFESGIKRLHTKFKNEPQLEGSLKQMFSK